MLIDTLITFTPEFKREYKRLAKKHSSLATDLQELVASLKANPTMGNVLVSDNSGNTAYKIRLAISSKNKGKSGGARVITYFLNKENELS